MHHFQKLVSASVSVTGTRTRSRASRASALAVVGIGTLVAIVAACGDSESRECRVGVDCASGVCDVNGRCVASLDDASTGGTDASDDGALPDGTTVLDAGSDAQLPGCVPNKDGVITRDEVPIQAGLYAKYRVALDVDVSTAGTPLGNGRRAWDFSGTLPNDQNVIVETLPLTNKWYAPSFTSATYAARLREAATLVGVFETSPSALKLLGVVSPDNGTSRTELKNDPAVATIQFPLKLGDAWTSDVSVSGVAQGIPVAYSEKYESTVDVAGELKTPLATFEVLRVRIDLTRTIGFSVTTSRTYAFITECYGNIATVASEDNESDAEFNHAVEIRRIAP